MDLQLEESVVIVTGASRGLGRAIAEALLAEGARVVVAARSREALDELAATAPDRVLAVACDMTDRAAVEALVPAAVERFGDLHGVINNAGIAPAGALLEMDDDRWQEILAVNVLAPVALTRAAGRHFVTRGGGKVVNVASTSGLRGKATLAAYSSSKGALLRFTEAAGAEWGKLNIQVNAIAPGAFATEAQQMVLDDPDLLQRRLRKITARRMGRLEEIGPLACYLVSPLSDYVTGSIFVIDGGEATKL